MTFDPKKPFQTRRGERHTLIAILDKPTPTGGTILAQGADGTIRHSFSDGTNVACCSDYDLINTPEKIEIEAWAVVNINGALITLNSDLRAAEKDAERLKCTVVPLTGTFER